MSEQLFSVYIVDNQISKFDLRDLRNAFGTFLTGVTVVTTRERNGTPRGFTANSFTSVSLDPPMLLICIDKVAESFDVFTSSPGFAVNILAEDQADTSGLFASKRSDKFEITDWTDSETGYPILDGVCAWFDCRQHQMIDVGDHVIIVGEVLNYSSNDSIGLGYLRGGYMSLGMERSAAKASDNGSDVVVGAIIEHDGKILLYTDPVTQHLYVPASGLDGSVGSLQKFQADIEERGVRITISSLFAVYENEESGQQSIYYRATSESERAGDRFWAFNEIPWDRVQSSAMTTMLKRYVEESSRQRFGIYIGSDKDGAVKTLSE